MIFANKLPKEIEDKLYNFSDWFFKQDLENKVKLTEKKLDTNYAISNEYLELLKAKPNNIGFPEETYGADFKNVQVYDTESFQTHVNDLDKSLREFCGTDMCALKMYYPPQGYIGWHNNANAPGYNILFTYSETGEGDFRYIHPLTGELVILPDKKGWSCKIGYYDVIEGNPLWHAAWTNCNRLNWAYIIHPTMWTDMANELGIDPKAMINIVGKDPFDGLSFKRRR